MFQLVADISIPGWLQPFVTTILTAVSALVVALIGLLVKKISGIVAFKEQESQGLQTLTEGIVETQRVYVDALKQSSEDGKLTSEEMQEARDKAIDYALAVAKGPGKDFLVALSRERLAALVELVLSKLKLTGFGDLPH